MRNRVVICTLIAFLSGFFVVIPDYATKLIYGLISATLCAVLVWISGKVLLHLGKSRRVIILVSIFWTVLLSLGPHFLTYLLWHLCAPTG